MSSNHAGPEGQLDLFDATVEPPPARNPIGEGRRRQAWEALLRLGGSADTETIARVMGCKQNNAAARLGELERDGYLVGARHPDPTVSAVWAVRG